MYWDQLTSPALDKLNRSIPVILPVSATEQHGSHLPLATDRLIGEYFCGQLNAQIPDEVLILPSMGIGCSEHHLAFAGSLSLRHETFIEQAIDILGCVYHHGFRNLIILNSHGGNQGAGLVVFEKFGFRHPDSVLTLLTWWRLAAEELFPLNETGPGGVGHAGEFETALMLLIAPGLVKMDQVVPPQNTSTFDWAEGDMLRGGRAALYRTMKSMTPNGVFGDPRSATAAKGEVIASHVLKKLRQLVSDLHHSDSAQGK